jgi:uncharacterized Zn-finger protein
MVPESAPIDPELLELLLEPEPPELAPLELLLDPELPDPLLELLLDPELPDPLLDPELPDPSRDPASPEPELLEPELLDRPDVPLEPELLEPPLELELPEELLEPPFNPESPDPPLEFDPLDPLLDADPDDELDPLLDPAASVKPSESDDPESQATPTIENTIVHAIRRWLCIAGPWEIGRVFVAVAPMTQIRCAYCSERLRRNVSRIPARSPQPKRPGGTHASGLYRSATAGATRRLWCDRAGSPCECASTASAASVPEMTTASIPDLGNTPDPARRSPAMGEREGGHQGPRANP